MKVVNAFGGGSKVTGAAAPATPPAGGSPGARDGKALWSKARTKMKVVAALQVKSGADDTSPARPGRRLSGGGRGLARNPSFRRAISGLGANVKGRSSNEEKKDSEEKSHDSPKSRRKPRASETERIRAAEERELSSRRSSQNNRDHIHMMQHLKVRAVTESEAKAAATGSRRRASKSIEQWRETRSENEHWSWLMVPYDTPLLRAWEAGQVALLVLVLLYVPFALSFDPARPHCPEDCLL